MTSLDVREIPFVDTRYMAREDGRIISLMHSEPRVLAAGPGTTGKYMTVSILLRDGRRVNWNVHRLICLAFHGLPPELGMEASHLNGNGLDNRAANLAWETPSANRQHKVEHGTTDRGLGNSRTVMTPERLREVWRMRSEGARHQDIADSLGVSRTTISRILSKRRYVNAEQ